MPQSRFFSRSPIFVPLYSQFFFLPNNPFSFPLSFLTLRVPAPAKLKPVSPSQAPHAAPGYVQSVGVYPASLLPYSSVVTSSRILVHLPALRSHPGSILSGDERVSYMWWGWRFRYGGWFLLHVSGLRFVNALGVVGEDTLQSNLLGQSMVYAG